MAAPRYSDEVLLTLNSVDPAKGFEFPQRQILLSKHKSSQSIGRTSKRDSAYFAHNDNCWFDSPVMSREHAELRLDADTQSVKIVDTSSLHGTYVNNHRVQHDTPLLLKNDDKITLGVTIDKGTTKFAPCVFKVNMNPGTHSRPEGGPTVFRVPDDSDVEEADGTDTQIEHAVGILATNGLRPGILNASSTIEAVDLTQDEPSLNTGSEDLPIDLSTSFANSVQDFDTGMASSEQTQLSADEHATISQVDGNSSDASAEVSSPPACPGSPAIMGLEALLQLVEDEEEDGDYEDSEREDEYSSEMDNSLPGVTNESVCDSEEEHSEDERFGQVAELFPPADLSLDSSTGGAVADMECVALPETLPPVDHSVDLANDKWAPMTQLSKAPVDGSGSFSADVRKDFSDLQSSEFFQAREDNKKRMTSTVAQSTEPWQTPLQEHTNAQEPLGQATPKSSSSNFRDGHYAAGGPLTPQSLKRKAADMSGPSLEETQSQTTVMIGGLDLNGRASLEQTPRSRPVKRLRRLAEVAGYAALGGAAVMGALIATAPAL